MAGGAARSLIGLLLLPAALARNPVLRRELRTRMRVTRSQWLLFGYALVLCAVVFFQLLAYAMMPDDFLTSPWREPMLGRGLFTGILIAQALLVVLVTPAFTAGALTGEREQRTLEMLVTTRLTAAELVSGKLLAAAGFAGVLALISLPLAALSLLQGGVAPAELLAAYAVLLCAALFYGALGLLASALARSTTVAVVGAYVAAVGVLLIGLGIVTTGLEVQMGSFPFGSIHPVAAPYFVLRPEGYFAFEVPSWTVGVAFNLVGAFAAYRIAAAQVEHLREPRPWAPFAAATLFWALITLLFFGALTYQVRSTTTGGHLVFAGQAALLLLAVAVPFLGVLGGRVRRGVVIAVWTGIVLLGFGITAAHLPAGAAGAEFAVAAVVVALVVGCFGIATCWRVWLGSLAPAAVVTYLVVFLLFCTPWAVTSAAGGRFGREPITLPVVAYASLPFGVAMLDVPQDPERRALQAENLERLPLAPLPPWAVGCAIWLLIGAAGFGLAGLARLVRRPRQPAAPAAGPRAPPASGDPRPNPVAETGLQNYNASEGVGERDERVSG